MRVCQAVLAVLRANGPQEVYLFLFVLVVIVVVNGIVVAFFNTKLPLPFFHSYHVTTMLAVLLAPPQNSIGSE